MTMSFHFHPGAYEHIKLTHSELIEQAEVERQLRDITTRGPSPIARARLFCGSKLIALGERIARPVAVAARP
jgi:hypothetical protein